MKAVRRGFIKSFRFCAVTCLSEWCMEWECLDEI